MNREIDAVTANLFAKSFVDLSGPNFFAEVEEQKKQMALDVYGTENE